ncbi:MAG: preprotein translocase subunit SecG [Candidatus Wildermuthbacteria bacterium]|nr:preprotein translocase subunit SecG [Candidatus Wildermuthbacteria bacterium]
MNSFLPVLQIIISLLLIILILLQQRGSGLGSAFGGDGATFATRRGLSQKLHWLTMFLGAAFIALAVLNLLS